MSARRPMAIRHPARRAPQRILAIVLGFAVALLIMALR